MEDLVSLCKRRGFVFPASEIYGGINGFWDYGPLGAQLKNNLRDAWWQDNVLMPPMGPNGEPVSVVGLDSAIIQNPKVWEASGHLAGFADPMRKCAGCGHFVRDDHLWETLATASEWHQSLLQEFTPISGAIDSERLMRWAKTRGKKLAPNLALVRNPEVTLSWIAQRVNGQPDAPPDMMEFTRYFATEQLHATGLQEPCPRCGGPLGEPKAFKLMFETWAGLVQDDEHKVYLRPETAQGIFLNYKNVLDTSRVRVPFGIAQVGKSFRNEVTPRNFIFRSREFEQMELEWFCHPDEARKWFEFWRDHRMQWWQSIGLAGDNLVLRQHESDELSHYAKEGVGTADVEYRYPFTAPGFGELEGIAHRTNFDLAAHQQHSKAKLEYFDQERNERYLPHVIEPAAGLTRGVLAILCEAYTRDESRASPEIMKFHPRVAPIKAAVFPLVNKDGMPEVAQKLHAELRARFGRLGMIETDPKQSIGKRYARMDEAGCPVCFTIDGETMTAQTVTARDRDTGAQEKIALDKVSDYVAQKLGV
ncbi:MAG: glycine--tRNA ligase [Phycisphaerales bacterium]|nr:MAG: glycine--tRNA ligase [Phycisphaerales bacterium]